MNDSSPEGRYFILHIGSGPSYAEIQAGERLVVGEADIFELSTNTWIERLERRLAVRIQKACEPPHYRMTSGEEDRHLFAALSLTTAATKDLTNFMR